MRRLATLVAMLLLFSGAAPLLACVADGATSHQDSACCRIMHNQCGEMAKTGCCKVEIKPDQQPQLATASPAIPLQWTSYALLANVEASNAPGRSQVLKFPDEHSPPGLVLVRIANLRI